MRWLKQTRQTWAWALYDWANSAFATTVLAGFFPIFFKNYWDSGSDAATSTFHLSLGNSIASIVIVLAAPVLGAIADQMCNRKRFLLLMAITGVLSTASLFWVGQGHWVMALVCFCAATIGFMGANLFYDALIVFVSDEEQRDLVSALGYAMGYLGGGVLFSINVAMTLAPAFFGLESAAEAVRFSFITVAIWWTVFAIPLFLYVKEPKQSVHSGTLVAIRHGLMQLWSTMKQIGRLRNVYLFLLAYWFYIDGVDTVVRMAVDFGLSIGLEQNSLIIALLIAQFVGFPATIAYGYMALYIGTKNGLYVGLVCYCLVCFWAYFMTESWEFYALAAAVGLVQGGMQSLSRSMYSSIIPQNQVGEFFGFYNMMGKSATIIGPLLVGLVSMSTGDHRLGMLSILSLFVIGAIFLIPVRYQRVVDK